MKLRDWLKNNLLEWDAPAWLFWLVFFVWIFTGCSSVRPFKNDNKCLNKACSYDGAYPMCFCLDSVKVEPEEAKEGLNLISHGNDGELNITLTDIPTDPDFILNPGKPNIPCDLTQWEMVPVEKCDPCKNQTCEKFGDDGSLEFCTCNHLTNCQTHYEFRRRE